MKIELHPLFKRAYRARIERRSQKLIKHVAERIDLFRQNPQNPILKDHQLTGKKRNYRSFSITGDIRIVYFPVSKDHVIFTNIGTHNQVY